MINGDLPSDNFRPNNDVVFTLPLGGKICKGNIVIEGNITLAGGTTSGTPFGGSAIPAHMIKSIIIRATAADGSRYYSGEIVNSSPRSLLRYAIAQRRKYIGEINASQLGGGAIGAYGIYQSIPLYFADPNVARQYTTALNADIFAYKTIQVIVRCGDITTMFPGNDRVADYSGLRVRWVDERQDLNGDTLTLIQEDHVVQIPASNKTFVDNALESDGAYLNWFLMTEVGADHHLSEGVLNRLKLTGNGIAITDFEPNDIHQKMFDDSWWDASQDPTGQYFIDLSEGNVYKPIPGSGLRTVMDITMLSGANVDQLRVYTRRYFSPARFQNLKPMEEYTR
jgi:hypothetical protein